VHEKRVVVDALRHRTHCSASVPASCTCLVVCGPQAVVVGVVSAKRRGGAKRSVQFSTRVKLFVSVAVLKAED